MTVEHHLPMAFNDGLLEAYEKHDLKITRYDTGGRIARYWGDKMLKSYNGSLVMADYDSIEIAELRAFIGHIRANVSPFWISEVFNDTHTLVWSDHPANGLDNAFIMPFRDPATVLGVYQNDAYVYPSLYRIYEKTNYIGRLPSNPSIWDDNAGCVETIGAWTPLGSSLITRYEGESLDGLACWRVDPAVSGANIGARMADTQMINLNGAPDWTFGVWVKGEGTFHLRTRANPISALVTTSPARTCTADSWRYLTVNTPFDPSDDRCRCDIYRVEEGGDPWFFDCPSFSPGSNQRWFLPSTSAGLILFDTPPLATTRIKTSATGRLMVPVALDTLIRMERENIGTMLETQFRATEVVER